MLDALPYLGRLPLRLHRADDEPLPAGGRDAQTLKDQGLSPEDASARLRRHRAGDSADATHPKGKEEPGRAGRGDRGRGQAALRLQHADGGWGWWKEGESDRFMTACVVWGLALGARGGRRGGHQDALRSRRELPRRQPRRRGDEPGPAGVAAARALRPPGAGGAGRGDRIPAAGLREPLQEPRAAHALRSRAAHARGGELSQNAGGEAPGRQPRERRGAGQGRGRLGAAQE